MGITLDGIAKGYIADRVSAVLTSAGVKNHLVNAGGDIMASGHKSPGVPWRVAVQSTTGPAYAGELSLSGKAIATSGSYEIYYDASRRHHHLINGLRLQPRRGKRLGRRRHGDGGGHPRDRAVHPPPSDAEARAGPPRS
mgnify:CR=1 FL=1